MASFGLPDPTPPGSEPLDEPGTLCPPGAFPTNGDAPSVRENALGPDEPSAPVDVPEDSPRTGIGPDVPPGDPSGPDLGA
jgi:hypothetical protein